MIKVVLDTNVIISHVAGEEHLILPPLSAAVSVVTVYELNRYPGMTAAESEAIEVVLRECQLVSLNEQIAQRAAIISRTRPRLHTLDVFIAATALELGVPLITKNIKDFRKIPGLKVKTTP